MTIANEILKAKHDFVYINQKLPKYIYLGYTEYARIVRDNYNLIDADGVPNPKIVGMEIVEVCRDSFLSVGK